MAFPYYPYQPYYPATYQPTQPAQSGIIWISGEREAAMYPVAPNNAVTLWSQTEPVVYLKKADASGKPTITTYDLVERPAVGASPQGGNLTEYATRSELTAFNAALEAIRGEVESIRGDLYGLAGKKKTKKEEETE